MNRYLLQCYDHNVAEEYASVQGWKTEQWIWVPTISTDLEVVDMADLEEWF